MNRLFILCALLSPLFSIAHPGHGPVENGLSHYLTSPVHLVGFAVAAVAAVVVYRYQKVKK